MPALINTPGGTCVMWTLTGMRCASRTQVNVGSSIVAAGNRLLVRGGRRFRLSTRVIEVFDRDGIPRRQLRTPLELLERHQMLSLSGRECGLRICKRDPVTLLVDDEQDVA